MRRLFNQKSLGRWILFTLALSFNPYSLFITNSMARMIRVNLYKTIPMGYDEYNVHHITIDDQASVQSLLNEVQALGFNPDTLIFIEKSRHLKADLTLADYVIKHGHKFKAEVTLNSLEQLQINFIKATADGDDNTVTQILSSIPGQNRRDFVANCRAKNDQNKIPLYYAARKGHMNVLRAIEALISRDDMIHLHSLTDDEGRTILMAAAQTIKMQSNLERNRIVDFVLSYTPADALKKVSHGAQVQGTAYDWAVLRNEEDPDILHKLLTATGTINGGDEEEEEEEAVCLINHNPSIGALKEIVRMTILSNNLASLELQ